MHVQFTLLQKGNNFAQFCETADIKYYRDVLGYKVISESIIETDDPEECVFDTKSLTTEVKRLSETNYKLFEEKENMRLQLKCYQQKERETGTIETYNIINNGVKVGQTRLPKELVDLLNKIELRRL